MDRAVERSVLELGLAERALPGESASGDLHVVQPVDRGVLVGVVDGLGHGEEAAHAARTAVATVSRYAHEPVHSVLQRCHRDLIGTRGVVMSLAKFDTTENTMTWLGVGNVAGVLRPASGALPASVSLVTRGGIVGSELPLVRPWVIPVNVGDLILFATDGIGSGFEDEVSPNQPPQQLAYFILSRFGRNTDDALVLVARYWGAAGFPP